MTIFKHSFNWNKIINIPLCIRNIGCEKSLDFMEHEANFKASRTIIVDEICYCSRRYLHWSNCKSRQE